MPGLFDIVRRIEELGGEIKAADAIVTEDTVHRDRAKGVYDKADAKLAASVKAAVDKRAAKDELVQRLTIEAAKVGEPLDPSDHTPKIIEDEHVN